VSGRPPLSAATPDGWSLEALPRQPEHALLRAPSGHMVTLDFRKRGIRTGYNTTGRFLGEDWSVRRKKYVGRGWRQELVDDAVAHLQELAVVTPGKEMS
jgi:hypothetical protein